MEKCKFCEIARTDGYGLDLIDKPLMVGQNYLSILSVGNFVQYWTLVLSREHKLNMSADYKNAEFFKFLNSHLLRLKSLIPDRRFIFFEHGAGEACTEIGCGLDHAHLHAVAYSESLLDELNKELKWDKIKFSEVKEYAKERAYLLYCEEQEPDCDTAVFIAIPETTESQFFRRILAKVCGTAEDYNYKTNPTPDYTEYTRKLL